MESDFLRHMKDGNNYDDIEMPVGMRGSGLTPQLERQEQDRAW